MIKIVIIAIYAIGVFSVRIDVEPARNLSISFSQTRFIELCFVTHHNFSLDFWTSMAITINSPIVLLSYSLANFGVLVRLISPQRTEGLTRLFMAPKNNTCVDITFSSPVTDVEYSCEIICIRINNVDFDIFLISMFVFGAMVFHYAPDLCQKQSFYYVVGCFFATFLSLFVVCFVMFKFFYSDMKSLLFSAAIIGAASAFAARLYYNFVLYLLANYIELVITYLVVICLFTCAIIYYKGPVVNPRLINIVNWCTQLIGIALIFFSARSLLGSIALIVVVLLSEYLAFSSLLFRTHPAQKFMTMEEFEQESRIETRKEIDNLRNWLRENTKRAAYYLNRSTNKDRDFVEGGDHISLSEALEHEKEYGDHESQVSDVSEPSTFSNDDSILTEGDSLN